MFLKLDCGDGHNAYSSERHQQWTPSKPHPHTNCSSSAQHRKMSSSHPGPKQTFSCVERAYSDTHTNTGPFQSFLCAQTITLIPTLERNPCLNLNTQRKSSFVNGLQSTATWTLTSAQNFIRAQNYSSAKVTWVQDTIIMFITKESS